MAMRFGVSATGLVLAFSIIGTTEGIRLGGQVVPENYEIKHPRSSRTRCEIYSCDQPWYDEVTQKWKEPRQELRGKGGISDWKKAHKIDVANLAKAANETNLVVILGDSITEALGRPTFSPRKASAHGGYAPRGGGGYETLPTETGLRLTSGVMPFAIGGDGIHDLAYRLFELGGMDALKTAKPKTVMVAIGTNDFGNKEKVQVAKTEMEIFVKQLKAELPSDTHLVLMPPLPRGNQPGSYKLHVEWWDSKNPAYVFNQEIISVLKSTESASTTFLDCSSAFMRQGIKSRTKLDYDLFEGDHLHLSPKGYSKWASCIEQGTGVRIAEKVEDSP